MHTQSLANINLKNNREEAATLLGPVNIHCKIKIFNNHHVFEILENIQPGTRQSEGLWVVSFEQSDSAVPVWLSDLPSLLQHDQRRFLHRLGADLLRGRAGQDQPGAAAGDGHVWGDTVRRQRVPAPFHPGGECALDCLITAPLHTASAVSHWHHRSSVSLIRHSLTLNHLDITLILFQSWCITPTITLLHITHIIIAVYFLFICFMTTLFITSILCLLFAVADAGTSRANVPPTITASGLPCCYKSYSVLLWCVYSSALQCRLFIIVVSWMWLECSGTVRPCIIHL